MYSMYSNFHKELGKLSRKRKRKCMKGTENVSWRKSSRIRSWRMCRLPSKGWETLWKSPWCWERLRARGEGVDTGWDGWMASLTQWRQAPGDSEGQGSLVCCSPWGHKELAMTKWLKTITTERSDTLDSYRHFKICKGFIVTGV